MSCDSGYCCRLARLVNQQEIRSDRGQVMPGSANARTHEASNGLPGATQISTNTVSIAVNFPAATAAKFEELARRRRRWPGLRTPRAHPLVGGRPSWMYWAWSQRSNNATLEDQAAVAEAGGVQT